MNVLRFFALILIFAVVTAAWMILGASMWVRTSMLDSSLSEEMNSLWGPQTLSQAAPFVGPKRDTERDDTGATGPAASAITADIDHQHRHKGLLWYSTFTLTFEGKYTIPAPAKAAGDAPGRYFHFPLPRGVTSYDDLQLLVDDANVAITEAGVKAGRLVVPVPENGESVVTVRYVTRGRDAWVYAPGEAPGEAPSRTRDDDEWIISTPKTLSRLRNFTMTVTTDFTDIDYPKGTRSPSRKAGPANGGMTATWRYANALTNQAMGITMPKRTNAGPIVKRMSFFAPVSLLFFFAVVFTLVVLRKIPLHPMHYLFVAAGFFAFHILMAYLVDVINLKAAFWTSAGVSVFLVVSYMRLVAGVKFGVLFIGLAQLIYLVGFSYAFFWARRTGLTVTIVAVITLFLLMQATARVNWFQAFRRRDSVPPPLATGAPPAAGEES